MPNGGDFIWRKFLNQGLPPAAIETISCSLSASSQRQYRSSFTQWSSFCTQSGLDPYDISPTQVIAFFQHILETKPITYNSFVTHRAALSLVSAHDLTEDPLISRYMKGLYQRRPPVPKHTFSWDPKLVLDYLESLSPSSLVAYSKKLLTLMLLNSAQRLQTMAAIKIFNIRFTAQGVSIWIDALLKTSRPGTKILSLHFADWPSNPALCIPTLLKEFLIFTKSFRQTNVDFLFITSVPPHTPASVPTLARWTKLTLQEAGIDVSKFSAHSTRHSLVSSAARLGLPVDAIFNAAGWSPSSGMFARVYNRPLQDPYSYSKLVMESSATPTL